MVGLRSRALWGMVALGVVTISVAFYGFGWSRPSDFEREHEAGELLVQAVGDQRIVRPRLSGDFPWAKWQVERQPRMAAPLAVRATMLGAVAKIEGWAIDATENPSLQQALGVGLVLAGEAQDGVRSLEAASALHPSSATFSDLSAAYLVLAERSQNVEHVLKALEASGRALALDPNALPALFNQALALERLGPVSAAQAAWRRYLEVDESSGWAQEARASGASATESTLDNTPTVREQLEQELMVRWANAVRNGDAPVAAAAIEQAHRLVGITTSTSIDKYAFDLLSEALTATRAGRAGVLAAAFHDAHEARRLITEQNRIEPARHLLDSALSRLTDAKSATYDFARYWQLMCEWYQKPTQVIEVPLRALVEQASSARHRYLAARSQVFLGSALQRLSRYSEAIDSYRAGVDALAELGELDAEASSRMLLARALMDHGLWRDAWAQELAALGRYDRLAAHGQKHNVARQAVRLFLARRQAGAAWPYLDVLESNANAWGDVAAQAEVHLFRGRAHLLLADVQRANDELTVADRMFASVADAAFRSSYRLELDTLRAEVLTSLRPDEGVTTSQGLIERSKQSGSLYRLARAYLLLGRASMAAKRESEAEAAWRSGIQVLEDEGSAVRDEQLRIARTSDIWDLYDELIRLLVSQDRDREALEIAERGRARALLDSVHEASGTRRVEGQTRSEIRATVLYYSALPTDLLVWVIDHDRTTLRRLGIGAASLKTLVDQLDGATERDERTATALLTRLHGVLVSPVKDLLRPRTHLVIIPDRSVASIPFAALIAPDTGRYLIEDHAISVAPSLALLGLNSSVLTKPLNAPVKALLSGVPMFESAGDWSLEPLPGALTEVKQIGDLYEQSHTLQGDEARAEAFLSAAAESDIIHFAGHAVSDPEFPSRSFLAMAGRAPDALLTPARISAARFPKARLVVLSACSTAGGAHERGEGVLNLARPFLAAGVPQVMATLRPIRDNVGPLLVQFHQAVLNGHPSAIALQRAQLDAIRRGGVRPLSAWAAFVLIGGVEQAPTSSLTPTPPTP